MSINKFGTIFKYVENGVTEADIILTCSGWATNPSNSSICYRLVDDWLIDDCPYFKLTCASGFSFSKCAQTLRSGSGLFAEVHTFRNVQPLRQGESHWGAAYGHQRGRHRRQREDEGNEWSRDHLERRLEEPSY